MARIVPKLNLNKTPELVDNHSLIFAKNIRFNANGLSADFGFNKICSVNEDFEERYKYYSIVGIIPYNTKFYILLHSTVGNISAILEYDETTPNIEPQLINTKWKWSGGEIDGECSVNLRGDILLTIAEAADNVPIKTINITQHKNSNFVLANIDESFYTQAPEIPLYDLSLSEYYINTIPAGTYQFFIRYEIFKDYYTDWFPASKELFAGYEINLKTNQGGLKYIDKTRDSSYSFRFNVNKLYNSSSVFKSFQLGFILAHDDEVYGRAYKHYALDTEVIDFDYDTEYIEEIDVKDLLYPAYDLYNVGNLTEYKNKLYVSNYNETNFNPSSDDIDDFVNAISIDFSSVENVSTEQLSDETPITVEYSNNIGYITAIDGDTVPSIIEDILEDNISILEDETPISGFETHTQNHINVIYTKSIEEFTLEEYKSIYDTDSVDEYITIINEKGDEVQDKPLTNVIADIIARTLYISAYNGSIRSDKTTGPAVRYTLIYFVLNGSTVYKCTVNISFSITHGIEIQQSVTNNYTLIPHQKYNFYVHFVTDKGEITNGYPISNTGYLIEEVDTAINAAIYPVFTFGASLPSRFRACFISILHTENIVAQVFDIHNVQSDTITIGDCLELDTYLYSSLKNIQFVSYDVENIIDYRASYDNESYFTFGASGKCVFRSKISSADLATINNRGFIYIPYKANSEYSVLTKCTPWIIPSVGDIYDNYNDLNLLGYICTVKKPLDNLDRYFVDSDIYVKTTSELQSNVVLNLTESPENTSTHEFDDYRYHRDSNQFVIYSNFNLNFLALRNTITERIVSKRSTATNTQDTDRRYVLLSVHSITLSEIYELPSMYKSYTKRVYNVVDYENNITKFTNVIRSSRLEGDEAKVYGYKFLATDYYNVPTDKGIIINLVAVGDNILVHTQDSIYKFSGQNSLTAAGGEDVQMKESEVFDTGIQELFGSEYGYAGLADKKHQILSEFGYTFWDKDSGRIYLYTGNAQMKVLSDDITKLLRRKPIINLYLADDYYNNRIFICIEFDEGNYVKKYATLSYDFVAKSFISLHDFKFDWSFKTKTKCYFVHNNVDIFKVGTEIGSYLALSTDDTPYPNHKRVDNDGTYYDCIVDIIFNDRFEAIKTLNVLSWICNEIVKFDSTFNMAEETFTNEPVEIRYKGNELTIYTDSCATDTIDISNRSNDTRLRQSEAPFDLKPFANSYKEVRYNLGKWTFNYFRNILNRTNTPISPRMLDREDTLVYGKYIVARFVFHQNVNFKFEDVTFFTDNNNNV